MRRHIRSLTTAVLLLAALCVFAFIPADGAAHPPGVVMLTEAELAALPPFPADLERGMLLGAVPPGATLDLGAAAAAAIPTADLGAAAAAAVPTADLGAAAAAAIPPGVAAGLGGAVAAAPASAARNFAFTCPPAILFNPDAGVGLITPGDGYTVANVEALSTNATTTKFYFCWRSGTTKTNWATVCRERGTGSMYGGSYRAEVLGSPRDLFCLASVSGSDAGAAVVVEVAK